MIHPIYKFNSYSEQLLDMYRAAFSILDYDHIAAVNAVENNILKAAEKTGNHEMSTDLLRGSMLQVAVILDVEADGHILIDASSGDWSSEKSAETISKLGLKSFRFPFRSGVVKLRSGYIGFSVIQVESEILGIPPTKQIIITFDTEDGTISGLVSEHANFSKDELVKTGFTEGFISKIYELLSVLLYVSEFKNDKELVSEPKTKKGKGKDSNGNNVGRHQIKLVKVTQKIRGGGGSAKQFNGAWVVRGHWRNQYYSKLDEHRPKWIEPYWKGKGDQVVEKEYFVGGESENES